MKEIIEKYNTKKTFIIAAVAVVLICALVLAYQAGKHGGAVNGVEQTSSTTISTVASSTAPVSQSGSVKTKTITTTTVANTAVSGICGLRITSPAVYGAVSFPLTIKGTISTAQEAADGCVWASELSNAGSAELFYDLRNQGWKSSGTVVPVTLQSTGASTSTLSFSASMNLYTTALGLTSGSPLKVVFTENSSHTPAVHSFTFYLSVR